MARLPNQLSLPSPGAGAVASTTQPATNPLPSAAPAEGPRTAFVTMVIKAGQSQGVTNVNVSQFGMSQIQSVLVSNVFNASGITVTPGAQSTAFGIGTFSSQMIPVYQTGVNLMITVTQATIQASDSIVQFLIFNTQQPPASYQQVLDITGDVTISGPVTATISGPVAVTGNVGIIGSVDIGTVAGGITVDNSIVNVVAQNTGQTAIPSTRMQGAGANAPVTTAVNLAVIQVLAANNNRYGVFFQANLHQMSIFLEPTGIVPVLVMPLNTIGQLPMLGGNIYKGALYAAAAAAGGSISIQEMQNPPYQLCVAGGGALAFGAGVYNAAGITSPLSTSLAVGTGAAGFLSGGSGTVEFWWKQNGSPGAKIGVFSQGSNNLAFFGLQIYVLAGSSHMTVEIDAAPNGAAVSTTAGTVNVCDNAFHHIAVVNSPGQLTVFVDGAADITIAKDLYFGEFPEFPSIFGDTVTIGCLPGSKFNVLNGGFTGGLQALAAWNYPRYLGPFVPPTYFYSGTEPGLVAFFKLVTSLADIGPGITT